MYVVWYVGYLFESSSPIKSYVFAKDVLVLILPYVLSKTFVLGFMTCVQVVLMVGALFWIYSLWKNTDLRYPHFVMSRH